MIVDATVISFCRARSILDRPESVYAEARG